MVAVHLDSYNLSKDATFMNRVQVSLLAWCINVAAEDRTAIPFHDQRMRLVNQILGSPTTQTNYVDIFTNSVATNATVLADATVGGTVPITSGNAATQAALITDVHIDNAIASQFNAYVSI